MSLFSIKDLSKEQIMSIIKRAIEFKNGANAKIDQPIANIFIEPSTRTLLSFKRAENKLGMEIYDLDYDKSSFVKNETIEDALLNMQSIGINNFIVRSNVESWWKGFDHSKFNIINGGDGIDNHPTQALLDAMTIYEKFGTLENLKMLVIGDTFHSRVFKSNKQLWEKFNSQVFSVSIHNENASVIDSLMPEMDVVMLLRVQHERHKEQISIVNYNRRLGMNNERADMLKDNAIIMHPGPLNRDIEISSELLYDHPKNVIIEQAGNGLFTRMAILEMFCKNI